MRGGLKGGLTFSVFSSLCEIPLSQPVLDESSNIIGVLVHHHHVRVAVDSDSREVDDVHLATALPHELVKIEAVLAYGGPARVLCDEVPVDRKDGNVLQSIRLLGIAKTGGLD